jgi:hypothetical protein
MPLRARYFALGVLLMIGVSGCPVTDDYYLLSADEPNAKGGNGEEAGSSDAGSSSSAGNGGLPSQGGRPADAGSSSGGGVTAGAAAGGDATVSEGGTGNGGEPAMSDAGAGGAQPCVESTERCNGHDDDCDDVLDEFVCKPDCSGFVLPGDLDHGYMYCTGSRKANWTDAKKACEDQDMRLAWLDSASENQAIALKLGDLGSDAEVLFGATDQGNEGDWLWVGGEQFWKGDFKGQAVFGRYSNWTVGTPNNNNNEDCALLITNNGMWGDRTCNAIYPYLCEQPD